MKIHNFLGNLAIKEKIFVFHKENQFAHVHEHFSLELPGINGMDHMPLRVCKLMSSINSCRTVCKNCRYIAPFKLALKKWSNNLPIQYSAPSRTWLEGVCESGRKRGVSDK